MTVVPYGSALNPGTPGTWQRDVWFVLNRTARVGQAVGRHRFRCSPPFTYGPNRYSRRLRVTAGQPHMPYGRSTSGKGYLTHMPHTVLFAWHRGELVGSMVAWQCGARTAYFRFLDEPDSPLCVMCQVRAGQSMVTVDRTGQPGHRP